MVTETPNLKLKKPAGSDFVDINVLNGNMDILDKAFSEVPRTVVRVFCKPNANVTAIQQNGSGSITRNGGPNGVADFNGLSIGTIWKFETGGQSEIVKVDKLYTELDLSVYIYGYTIDESVSDPNKRVEYTDESIGIQPASGKSLGGWANTKLFQGIKPVVKVDGGGFMDLNKRDLTKCVDGSPSNISSIGNDALTEFPTWYVHKHAVGKKKFVKIASKKLDDTYHAYHAMDNGVQRDCFHVGCYGAYKSGNKMYSSSGKTPSTNISSNNYANYSQARGKGYDQFSWFQWNFICALFVLAYKSCNSKDVFRGNIDGGSVQTENRTSFDNDFGLAGSSNRTEQMSFLWIQNLWGNMGQWLGGVQTNDSSLLMVILDGKDCTINKSDFTTVSSGGEGKYYNGYTVEMDMSSSKVGFFPKYTRGGSSTTNWCDYGSVNPSKTLSVGGTCEDGDSAGLFRISFDNGPGSSGVRYGSRLIYKGGRE